ncbi:MAG: histidine triad nucleotide-binding protein [Acidibacillus sp.]|uniref:HIT-like protein n=1 Tax=Sulfoacidibacillus ferrooxidans TaxID=2005001 RepID=A0A9X1V781_9BACL|nr:histidine triad nucleotide-binding protein [Sulfoacidibacillus ferrooxidans]MCI0182941.1 putative HIT-like protein [Sulfoacidibacillus ferrooxidans]MCY0893486.1 histidine triad nucleotide-binding protein [Acidibacillus sp.]
MDCIFCRIINGELPSKKIYESEHVLAFEDIQKAAPIHVLIVPKLHVESILELPEDRPELLVELHKAIKEVATLTGVAQEGFRLVSNKGKAAGQTVFHLHFHILGGRDLELTLA